MTLLKLTVAILAALGLVVGALIFVDYQRDHGPCGQATLAPARERLEGLHKRLEDSQRLAGVTSRIALSGPVASLQELARAIDAEPMPLCLLRAKYALHHEAESEVSRFTAFMAEESTSSEEAGMRADIYARRYREAVTQSLTCPKCPALEQWNQAAEAAATDKELAAAVQKRVDALNAETARLRAQ